METRVAAQRRKRVEQCRRLWRRRAPPAQLARLEAFAATLLGERAPAPEDRRQWAGRPTRSCFPGLEARPWHESARYPWLARLEREAGAVAAEGAALLAAGDRGDLEPGGGTFAYTGWRQLPLFLDGRPTRRAARCPRTVAALASLPFAGAAAFAWLPPGGRVETHCSDLNAKVVCHLALRAPRGCSLTVAGRRRAWKAGRTFVFDDTYPHSARNDGRGERLVLMIHAWHWGLSALEREWTQRLLGLKPIRP